MKQMGGPYFSFGENGIFFFQTPPGAPLPWRRYL